jgi:hypothetical protein
MWTQVALGFLSSFEMTSQFLSFLSIKVNSSNNRSSIDQLQVPPLFLRPAKVVKGL